MVLYKYCWHNSCWASQQTPPITEPEGFINSFKRPAMVPILSQTKPVHTSQRIFFKSTLTLSSISFFSLQFRRLNLICISQLFVLDTFHTATPLFLGQCRKRYDTWCLMFITCWRCKDMRVNLYFTTLTRNPNRHIQVTENCWHLLCAGVHGLSHQSG